MSRARDKRTLTKRSIGEILGPRLLVVRRSHNNQKAVKTESRTRHENIPTLETRELRKVVGQSVTTELVTLNRELRYGEHVFPSDLAMNRLTLE
jgi:hypothetical protein